MAIQLCTVSFITVALVSKKLGQNSMMSSLGEHSSNMASSHSDTGAAVHNAKNLSEHHSGVGTSHETTTTPSRTSNPSAQDSHDMSKAGRIPTLTRRNPAASPTAKAHNNAKTPNPNTNLNNNPNRRRATPVLKTRAPANATTNGKNGKTPNQNNNASLCCATSVIETRGSNPTGNGEPVVSPKANNRRRAIVIESENDHNPSSTRRGLPCFVQTDSLIHPTEISFTFSF